jgi:hypothetical protein
MRRGVIWLIAWVDLAVALVVIFTAGYARPAWDMDIRCWDIKRQIAKRKRGR